MVRTVASLSVLCAFVACGPGQAFDPAANQPAERVKFRVDNNYAESLFTISYAGLDRDGGTLAGSAFTDKRIAGNGSATSEEVGFMSGSAVTVTFSAMSLGEVQHFDPLPVDLSQNSGSTLAFTYDYDLATAKFRVAHRWVP